MCDNLSNKEQEALRAAADAYDDAVDAANIADRAKTSAFVAYEKIESLVFFKKGSTK